MTQMMIFSYGRYFHGFSSKLVLAVIVILHIVWITDSWKNVNDDTLSTPGCSIPNYNLSFAEEPESRQPACRRLIGVEKVARDRIKFVMKKHIESCCYSFVHSYIGSEDQEMRFTPCVPFKDQAETKLVSDVINVECDSEYETIYEDTYFLVKEVEVDRGNTTADKAWNVLILNMDGVSRRRAYNTLPRTIQFLHRNDWFDFRGYNAIENATVAILTGTISGNSTPLWLTYQRAGYVTASNQEDLLFTNTSEKPTHYVSLYSLADEINCTKQTADRILDYILDFTTTYRNKFFGFFSFKILKDELLANFLNKLTLTGVLYNTFVVLTSNGGDPLSSFEAFYDNRLPLSFMWTPTTFRRRFKTQFSFLKLNQWRLVSPLDFHLTLLNVLRVQSPFPSCPKCRSLFQKLSEYRYCSDAGVDRYWCACHNLTAAKLDHISMLKLSKAVNLIENETSSQATSMCTTCRRTKFKNWLRVHYSENETGVFYVVAFVMTPDVAMEMSLMKYLENDEIFFEMYKIEVLIERDRGGCLVNPSRIYSSLCVCEAHRQCFLGWILAAEILTRRAKLSRFDIRKQLAGISKASLSLI